MLEINTAIAEVVEGEEDQGKPFMVDGRECRFYQPGDGQVALLMTATASGTSNQEQIAGILNFFGSVLETEDLSYIRNRLLDRKDPFGLEQVTRLLEGMVEEWSGRPTGSPFVSTPSPRPTGPSSTRTTQPSISSV